MYWHYVRHEVKPSEWFAMELGERLILRAFMLKEIDEDKKARDEIESKMKGG